jgi:tetratricopeptide (TPR) repeat protein
MTAYILRTSVKTTAFTIALLTCHSCASVPPAPAPSQTASNPELEAGWEKTCYADTLTKNQASEIRESSASLEIAADQLATTGQHQEAVRKYNEAGAALLNEAIADGRAQGMENYTGNIEGFRKENRPLIQKSAEFNFKVGQSYAQLGKLESAIDCFNGTLKVGILPPNDAIAYLNRGDAYEKLGAKDKAKADFQQAANLFKKHKLPSYQKLSEQRLEAVSK